MEWCMQINNLLTITDGCATLSGATAYIYEGSADAGWCRCCGYHSETKTPRRSNLWFEHGLTKACSWGMVTIMGPCLSCDIRTLPVISTTSECKQNGVSAVWVPWTCSADAVWAPWQLDACIESAMKAQAILNLSTIGKPWSSVETSRPWERCDITIFMKNIKFH